ncbi:protein DETOXIFICATION 55 [Humulus lupulus]|uniref:protein DETOXIFICATION 55 n=1 Tax=Humulus lupulus TaxID=3486 RepID=UPI002B4090F3|nr:protein DETOXIFICATION 55 [Humulus lupulus]
MVPELEPEKVQKYPTMPEVVEELKRVTNIGFPILTMSLVNYLRNMAMVVCMGRLGSLELAGGALAIGFTNITGYSVLSGLAMGMDPLCSQAFGSQNDAVAFLTLQRTIFILLFASLPISLLWFNLEPLMLILNQNPDITKIASIYCKFAIPDLLANSLLHPLRIFLRSKSTTWPLMWSNLLAMFLHIPITILLTFKLSLGVQGIAISNFLTNFITLFILLLYLYYNTNNKECNYYPSYLKTPFLPKSWPIFLTNSTWEGWGVLIRLSIQSCLAVCLEWWWYEFMTLLAGYLPNPKVALATSAIVIQTTSLMYTLPSALSASVSTRVGNELGAGQPPKARLAAAVAVGIALITSLVGLVGTTFGRGAWGRVFTHDKEILKLTMAVLPIIGVCELANCPQTTSCGILRGSARPGIGAAINFYAFYLVGAPVAVVLGFVWKLGFLGLCYGLLAAQIACVVSILIVVYNTNWEKESVKAKDLMMIKDVNVDDDDHDHQIDHITVLLQ